MTALRLILDYEAECRANRQRPTIPGFVTFGLERDENLMLGIIVEQIHGIGR